MQLAKRLFTFLLFLSPLVVWGQGSTPNLGLALPAPGATNWNIPMNGNSSIIDTFSVSNATIQVVTVAPTGACTPGTRMQLVTSTGLLYTCQSSVWALAGGGSFTALTGDATSTSTGGATTVVGLKGNLLPSLTTGFLNWTGTVWALSSVPASGFPITIGSTSIAANSTTTSIAGLTLTSPTFTTPALGTPASGVITSLTGTCAACNIGGNAATATNISTNGTANQVWGMNAGATAQGWQTAGGGGATFPGTNGIVFNTSTTASRNATGLDVSTILDCSDTSGSGTAQVCNTSPTFTPATGSAIIYTTTTANTGTGLTVNVNSLGAKSVAKWMGTTTLVAGDMAANKSVILTYDGTNWEMSSIGNNPAITNSGTAGQYGYYATTGNTISPLTTFNNANNTQVDTSTSGLNSGQLVVTGSQPQVYDTSYANDPTTGSIPLFLNKIASTGVVKATTADTGIPLFIVGSSSDDGASVVSNGITICQSGTTGNACLVQGRGTVTFDASGGTALQWCIVSTTTAGTCHSVANPSGSYCVGLVTANVAANGTGVIDTTKCTLQNPAGNGTVSNSTTAGLIAFYSTTGTTVSGDANLDDGHTTANTLTYAGTAGVTAPGFNVSGTSSLTAGGFLGAASTRMFVSGGAWEWSVATTTFATDILLSTGHRIVSTGYYGFSSSTTNAAAVDTALCRAGSAGVAGIDSAATCTNTVAGSTGGLAAAMFEKGGTTFTTNAGCTDTLLVGGASGGHFQVGVNTACTTIVTMGNSATAAHGWVCKAIDLTTPADLVSESATTTTTVTLGGTFSTSDVIWFSCDAV